jgi:hypothetical protein
MGQQGKYEDAEGRDGHQEVEGDGGGTLVQTNLTGLCEKKTADIVQR